jgi:hypothetical protein
VFQPPLLPYHYPHDEYHISRQLIITPFLAREAFGVPPRSTTNLKKNWR